MDGPRLVAVGLLTSGRRVLLVRRPSRGPLPGLWEFPGGKVEAGEHPWAAVVREVREELGVRVARGTLFGVYSHVYDGPGLRAHVVIVAYRIRVLRARVRETAGRKWATPEEIRRMPIVPGSRRIVRDLRAPRRP